MPRVKLTEHKAKNLILGEAYTGVALGVGDTAPEGTWVVKVDQGVKKRMKQGLVKVKVSPKEIPSALSEWSQKGFSRFIAEPFLPHESSDEQYLSLERVREGIRLLYAKEGGIEIEEHPEKVKSHLITKDANIANIAQETGIPDSFLTHLLDTFNKMHFAFLEINPLVILGDQVHLLDAAVLVDSAGEFFVRGEWTEDDVVEGRSAHEAEEKVASLQKTTPASLKLSVLNEDGSLFFLLSGGGGSIVIADEAALQGQGEAIGNYGEYSGGPTREETYLYAKEVLALMLSSKAKKKALVIAGGVANFTDVAKTFAGIRDALTEVADELKAQGIKIFIRRGGPNESKGLTDMKAFLETQGLLGSVHGSDAVITSAVDDAIHFVTP
ncbi:MAG: ATP citrate lyase citrate-binding domain-containing protein [Patescibacteria group bacterium]